MNALVGEEAKSLCALWQWRWRQRANDRGRKDGGDFAGAFDCRHLMRKWKFEGFHQGSGELETPLMMDLPVRSGWQLRVIALPSSPLFGIGVSRKRNRQTRVKESVARASSGRYHHSIN
jgi:hypothetical protein